MQRIFFDTDLTSTPSIDVPNFTVLIGTNNSGKTNILYAAIKSTQDLYDANIIASASEVSSKLNIMFAQHDGNYDAIVKRFKTISGNNLCRSKELHKFEVAMPVSSFSKAMPEVAKLEDSPMWMHRLLSILLVLESPDATVSAFNLIENGFHPFVLNRILENLRDYTYSHKKVLLFSTYSPNVVNQFKPNEVRLVTKDDRNLISVEVLNLESGSFKMALENHNTSIGSLWQCGFFGDQMPKTLLRP